MTATRPKLLALATGVAAMTMMLGACSSSGRKSGGPPTLGPKSTLPEQTGFDCPDPVGDIGTDTGANAVGKLTQPSGIDMTHASAKVEGDKLVVSFQTVGDLSTLAAQANVAPLFDMLQGDLSASADFTFELRATPATNDASGPWKLTLVKFKSGPEQKTELSTPVTVNGNTLTYEVPLKELPAIATLQWQFGTSSPQANGPTFFDDCTSLKSQPPAGGSTSSTPTTKG